MFLHIFMHMNLCHVVQDIFNLDNNKLVILFAPCAGSCGKTLRGTEGTERLQMDDINDNLLNPPGLCIIDIEVPALKKIDLQLKSYKVSACPIIHKVFPFYSLQLFLSATACERGKTLHETDDASGSNVLSNKRAINHLTKRATSCELCSFG